MSKDTRPFNFIDNGGRRIMPDRRKYSYTYHWPERRKDCGEEHKDNSCHASEQVFSEKRNTKDRRSGLDRRLVQRFQAQYQRS